MLKQQWIFSVFLVSWLIINLLQAYFTPLHYDEAYYYLYSRQLDWGYFDHPPMVALFIKIGFFFFQNEVGVRIVTILTNLLILVLLYGFLNKQNQNFSIKTLALFIASSVVFSMYSFITTPDSPFLLFGTLVLWSYQKFIESIEQNKQKSEYWWAVWLSFFIAAMLYSKYHGLILLLSILLANPSLFKQKSFYLIVLLAFVLFSPHILWQFSNNFPSLTYHLNGRTATTSWSIMYIFEYPLNQVVMFSPFVVYFIFYTFLKTSSSTVFVKTLKYVFGGFLIFFFLMTLKGHVEPHWTALAIIPATILTVNYLSTNKTKLNSFVKWTKIGAIALIFIRIILAMGIVPKTGIADKTDWITKIKKESQNLPVVFIDSYQKASLYGFYSKGTAYCIHTKGHRSSQFAIWNKEKDLIGKEIFVVASDSSFVSHPIKLSENETGGIQLFEAKRFD